MDNSIKRKIIPIKEKVTVCIPTYNRAELIGATLNSVVKQDFKKINILVIDNNSSDETEKVVKSFNDKRIQYFKNKKNLGFPGNLQRCFDLAKTEYLIFLADDDIFLQGAVIKLVEVMDKNPNCIIGKSADYRFFNDKMIPDIIDKQSNKTIILERGDRAISKSLDYSLGAFSGLIIRKEGKKIKVLSRGLLNSLIEPLFILLKEGDFIYYPEILVGLRCHNNLAYQIYTDSSYSRELFPIYNQFIKNENILKRTKDRFLKASVSDFFNIRLYGNWAGIICETKYIFENNYLVLLTPKFILYFILSLLLPKRVILFIKRVFIYINSKRIDKKEIVNKIIKN